MAILTTNEQISAALDRKASDLAAYVAAAVHSMNGMAGDLLALDEATLTSWLKANAAKLAPMFEAHAANGAILNQLVAGIAQQATIAPDLVDVRPVVDKLASQGRVIDWQTLTVSTPQPDPQQDPEPESPV